LGKYLPAVLPVARSQLCTAGVFQVTCNTDLSIQVDVDLACLANYYPTLSITDIQLSPQGSSTTVGASTCTACTDPTTCTAATSFFGDADQTVAVTSTTTSIFFNAGSCGTSYTESGEIFQYQTSIGSAFVIDANNILTDPQMPETSFTCSYSRDIDGVTVVVDPVIINDPTVDIIQDPTPAEEILDSANVEFTIVADKVGTDVVLGTNVDITLVKIDPQGLLTDFYFETCTASNMAVDDGSGNYKSFDLVTSGCAPTGTDPTTAAINAITADGKSLSYDQFGFIDSTDDSLTFHLSCDIRVGTWPTCTPTGRRRRNTDQEGPLIKFELDETVVDFHKVGVKEMGSNGIVYAVEQTPKASQYSQDESSSAAIVGASLMMAGANFFL